MSLLRANRPALHCDKAESVLAAIEEDWRKHHAGKPGFAIGLYTALAMVLNEQGVVIDTLDGLDVLEHCRRRNLPVVDILHVLEARVRAAGYRGDRLGLADFQLEQKPVYAFYDGARFSSFVDLKDRAHLRMAAPEPIALQQRP